MAGKAVSMCAPYTVYTVKKVIAFPVPSWDVTNQTLPGIDKLFQARESLVSDILAVDRKNYNLFLHCRSHIAVVLHCSFITYFIYNTAGHHIGVFCSGPILL